MRKGKQVKPGDKILIDEKNWTIINSALEKERGLKLAIATLGEELSTANTMIWKIIKQYYPQTDGFICSVNKEHKEIRVHYADRLANLQGDKV